MKILAPAKINIGLRVIKKRSDTYHDIETVFYPIHLSDELEVTKSDRHEFFSNITLENDANLCLHALHFYCERTGINAEVKITLKKNIPIGSGLGGGSSDAAAVLLALQDIYGMPLSEIELHDIAAQLGSDVPFFLKKLPAYATGKGEIIEPIKFHVTDYILTATPNVSVSTALAYSLVTPTGGGQTPLREVLSELGHRYADYKESVVNDFEPKVLAKFPVIGELKAAMYDSGADFSLMSGSGSSVYGFFKNEALARKAHETIKRNFELRSMDITSPEEVA